MVEMREADQLQLAGAIEVVQQRRERDRVGPARDRRNHAGIRRRQMVALDGPADSSQQIHTGQVGRAGQVGGGR